MTEKDTPSQQEESYQEKVAKLKLTPRHRKILDLTPVVEFETHEEVEPFSPNGEDAYNLINDSLSALSSATSEINYKLSVSTGRILLNVAKRAAPRRQIYNILISEIPLYVRRYKITRPISYTDKKPLVDPANPFAHAFIDRNGGVGLSIRDIRNQRRLRQLE